MGIKNTLGQRTPGPDGSSAARRPCPSGEGFTFSTPSCSHTADEDAPRVS